MRGTSVIVTVVLATLMACIAGSVIAKEEKTITYTTLDVKQNYEIVRVIAGYTQIETAMMRDPFDVAQQNAWAKLAEQAEGAEADAVVGIRMEFENITQNTVGRLIIYGTAVKYTE